MPFLTLREATPLLFVAESRSALVVAELSHGGCDVNLSDNCHFESLLSTAVKYGHYDIANLLLKNGANVDGDCRATLSPFFQAVVQHRGDLVEQLYPQGADINLLDADGGTAICQAAYQGDMDIVKLLLKSTNEQVLPSLFDMPDSGRIIDESDPAVYEMKFKDTLIPCEWGDSSLPSWFFKLSTWEYLSQWERGDQTMKISKSMPFSELIQEIRRQLLCL